MELRIENVELRMGKGVKEIRKPSFQQFLILNS